MLLSRRKELKLSRKQVSDSSGISVTSIAKYESGIFFPTVESLYKLSQIYEIDYSLACNELAKDKANKKE